MTLSKLAILACLTGCAFGSNGVPYEGYQEDNDFANTDQGISPLVLPVTGPISVTKIWLYDANSDQPIRQLADGDELSLADLPSAITIVAETSPSLVGSVIFKIDGDVKRRESEAPYSLAGDTDGNFKTWTPRTGTRVFEAVPFSLPAGAGDAGVAISFTLKIVD